MHETKILILDTAAHLFEVKGYEETTINDIMIASKLSKGAIYHHYKNKQAILDALLVRQQELLSQSIHQINDKNILEDDQLTSVLTTVMTTIATYFIAQKKWITKIPYFLLNQTNYLFNAIVPQISDIFKQVNLNYPKQLAETLVLNMISVIVPTTQDLLTVLNQKTDFVLEIVRSMENGILDEDTLTNTKQQFMQNMSTVLK